MSTPYQIVYDAFFSKIRDSFFLEIIEEEKDIELLSLLNQAIPEFKYPKVDLEDRNETSQQFNETLTNAEVQIISEAMKLKWIEQKINDEELIKMQFSDHDYSLMSQAAHLFRLITNQREIELKLKKMQDRYSLVKDRKPDFSGLAGGG
ncbi:MAG: hypothetical protein WCS33_00440 [Candidatus Caldatribacteriota bacterium]